MHHLAHEHRSVRHFPGEFHPHHNSGRSKYHRRGADGIYYLDIDLIGRDLDTLFPCECGTPNCDCTEYQPAGNISVDPVSAVAESAAKILTVFKKGDDAQAARQKLLAMKAQCPKKPFLRLSKKQKQQYKDYQECMKSVGDADREIARISGQAYRPMPGTETPKPGNNTALYWGLGIGGFLLIMLIVIMILVMRSARKAAEGKKK